MADALVDNRVNSPYTLRDLVQLSYLSSFRSRWDESKRVQKGEKHMVRIDSVTRWKISYATGVPEAVKVHQFRLRTFTNKIEGGRTSYQTNILMDRLSVDSPTQIRCGLYGKWAKKEGKDQIKKKGLCPDFYFVFMRAHGRQKSLIGRDTTNGFPTEKNPNLEMGMCKHLIRTIRILVASNFFGYFEDKDVNLANNKFIKFFKG